MDRNTEVPFFETQCIYKYCTRVIHRKTYCGDVRLAYHSVDSKCASKPCDNGGECEDDFETQNFKCRCHPLFTGERCQKSQFLSQLLYFINILDIIACIATARKGHKSERDIVTARHS